MTRFKVCLCGPRSVSAVTGVALAFDLFVESLEGRNISHRVVDATRGINVSKSGTFSFTRALDTLCVIGFVWFNLFRCKIYYATMSTSSLGFIRDYLTVGFAKLLGRRTVLHLHGGGFEEFYVNSEPWLQRLIRSNLKRIDTIVVLGELLKAQFYCAGEFVHSKLVVVPNGLTMGINEPLAEDKKLGDQKRVALLYLSSLMPSKGFFDVLEAMQLLEVEQPGRYHLNLCGSFVDAKVESVLEVYDFTTLHAYIKSHNLSNCVTYHGQVTGAAKEKQFIQANIFLLPTSYAWEGQPLSIIEALAFSTPVISCYHKGIPELVEEGVSGFFVEPENPKAIATSVVQMTADARRYERMSASARVHYETNFRREVHLERLTSAIMNSPECELPKEGGPS